MDYAKKKAFRILPMYYVSLVLTFLVGVFMTGEYPLDFKWLYHVVFLNMFIPEQNWVWWNSVNFFWTMPAFVAWYILAPLLFRYIAHYRSMAIMTLMVLIVTPSLKEWMYSFASKQFVNWNFFCLLYVFMFGSLAYFIVQSRKQALGLIYGIAMVAVGFITGNRSGFFVFGLGFYFMIILTSTIPISWSNEKLNRIIKWLSNVTWSVYLTHWFVLHIFGDYLSSLPWIIAYAGFIVLAWSIGGLAYKFIEQPIHNMLLSE